MTCRLNRMIRLVRMLNGQRYPSVGTLCSLFQIKERTLFADLKELKEELGVSILFDRNRQGYYLNGDVAEINLLSLDEETAVLLLAAFALLDSFGGSDFSRPLRDMFEREAEHCLIGAHKNGRSIASYIKHVPIGHGVDRKIFHALFLACLRAEKIGLSTLQSSDLITNSEELHPHFLIPSNSGWKLVYSPGTSGNNCELDASLIERLSGGPHI